MKAVISRMQGMDRQKTIIQIVWGVLLVLAGIGVFIRIHQVMPQILQIESFASASLFIRFCFYLLGILLIGGGSKKIYHYYQQLGGENSGK